MAYYNIVLNIAYQNNKISNISAPVDLSKKIIIILIKYGDVASDMDLLRKTTILLLIFILQ